MVWPDLDCCALLRRLVHVRCREGQGSGSEHDQDFPADQNKRQKSILRVIFGLHSDFRMRYAFWALTPHPLSTPLAAQVVVDCHRPGRGVGGFFRNVCVLDKSTTPEN